MRVLSLALLPAVALAYRPATVYLQPHPSSPEVVLSPPALSPFEANSVLANFVGLSRSILADVLDEVVDAGKKEWEYLWHTIHPRGETIGAGTSDVLMLLLQSDHPEDFVPSNFKPSFIIPNPPPSSNFVDLLSTYVAKAHAVFDNVISSIFHTSSGHPNSSSWKSVLDVFDLAASESSALFMDEFRALVDLVEGEDVEDEENFTALKLDGLSKIAEEHGRESEIYQTAAQSVQAILSQDRLKTQKLALIVIPSTSPHTHHHFSRDASNQQGRPIARSAQPVHSVSECFTTNEACTNGTDACSGRGKCVGTSRAGKTCYSCACSTTKDKHGRKSSWAGATCERKDISVPFVLLAGSVIFLVAIVIGSVQLLYSVGEGVLPSTLTVTSTGHLKRD